MPGLRLERLRAYLDGRVPGFSAGLPVTATLLSGGRSNISCLLVQGDLKFVVRRPPLGHVMPTAHDMRREHYVLSKLRQAGVAVPQVLHYCADEDVTGAPFLVMEYVSGRVPTEADTGALTPGEASALSAGMLDALASVHLVSVSGAGLADLGFPDGYRERQIRRWAAQWERTRTRHLDSAAALTNWLHQRAAELPPAAAAVLHGDFRLDNVIVGPADMRIRAILDWEMSTLGDPLADLALMLVYWSRPDDGLRRDVAVGLGATEAPGFWSRRELIDGYQERTGLAVADMDFYTALACFKLGVILESIHFRQLRGDQTGMESEGLAFQSAAPTLFRLGLNIARSRTAEALDS